MAYQNIPVVIVDMIHQLRNENDPVDYRDRVCARLEETMRYIEREVDEFKRERSRLLARIRR